MKVFVLELAHKDIIQVMENVLPAIAAVLNVLVLLKPNVQFAKL